MLSERPLRIGLPATVAERLLIWSIIFPVAIRRLPDTHIEPCQIGYSHSSLHRSRRSAPAPPHNPFRCPEGEVQRIPRRLIERALPPILVSSSIFAPHRKCIGW